MVRAAMRIDQLHPPAAEALEGVDLRGIDHILNDASDHASTSSTRSSGISAPVRRPHPRR